MSEEQGQAPTDTSAQEAASTTIVESQAGDSGMTDDELRRARSEAAKYRTDLREAQKELKELQKAQKERDDADKSELQKANERGTVLEAQVNEAQATVRKLKVQNMVVNKAVSMGIVDPDAAFRLLDLEAVEYEGDTPSNIDDLLTALVEAKPYLKGADKPKPKVSPTQPATKGGKTDAALTVADVQRMSDDEIAARLPEVLEVMAKEGASA